MKEKVEENKVRIKRGRVQACKIVYAPQAPNDWGEGGCRINSDLQSGHWGVNKQGPKYELGREDPQIPQRKFYVSHEPAFV